jgi:hypothetical protein
MATTKIRVTKADNELLLLASRHPQGSVELLHYKSGFNKPVDVTLYPGAMLASDNYDLTMIGINWGGPSSYAVTVTTDGKDVTYTGGGNENVGANWTNTIKISVENRYEASGAW